MMVSPSFTAIDVETANADMSSICQIGAVKYENGMVVEEWTQLIDPEDFFDERNIGIHGIREADTKGMPTIPEVYERLRKFLEGTVSVCHTNFDRHSLAKAFYKYQLPPLSTQWLDSARVARRSWPECAYSGYGLKPLSLKLGFEFRHHDALEDAKAAGHILLRAITDSGVGIEDWLCKVHLPISVSKSKDLNCTINPDGDLYGEVIVFTGSLTMVRQEAETLAANAGCVVKGDVTKKTTILVVGDVDVRMQAGHEKTTKHRKAEDLIRSGQAINIICEADFLALVKE